MKITDKNYIKNCPACEEAIKLGLKFEETHSSRKKGYLETDYSFIKSLHQK